MAEPDALPSLSRIEKHEGHNHFVNEKLACHVCRQRKVKCDKTTPCSNCVKDGAQCSYANGPKPRERRQRVMVSNTYDSKLDAISRKIDHLSKRMDQLSYKPAMDNSASRSLGSAEDMTAEESCSSSAFSIGLTSSSSSTDSTPAQSTPTHHPASEDVSEVHCDSFKDEYEGESSLFAHATFATEFLRNFINTKASTEVAEEMRTVLDGLNAAVRSGKQQSGTLNSLYPRIRSIPPGSTVRKLPLPPIEKVFACLRMAKECPQVSMLWLGDFLKPTQFNDYFVQVVSPGSATEVDLIIVHCGLYWLFCECAKVVTDAKVNQDYIAQASLCEANLQTVLSNLQFHQPTHLDVAYAMSMASLYCLQRNKISAAWDFITSASRTVQALGLQHNLPGATENPEAKCQKMNLFWTIYMTEKMLSLRLGRSSTLRDQDITLTRPGMERPSGSFLSELAPGWIRMASIQGQIYDKIYSPGALMQPLHIRIAHAQALATEVKTVMQYTQDIHDQYESTKGRVLGTEYHEIAKRSDRVSGLSMLTLIYRSIPPENMNISTFCQECINTARDTLLEHNQCVSAIIKAQGKTVLLEAYLNWTITHSPFIPFIIIFCHTIETSENSYLTHMRNLVETFESGSHSQAYNTCDKQRRLFRALYDVSAKYNEIKSRADNKGQEEVTWSMAQQQYISNLASQSLNDFGPGPSSTLDMVGELEATGTVGARSSCIPLHGEPNSNAFSNLSGPVGHLDEHNMVLEDVGMEMDLSGTQLWDWFNKSQSIMRMLEDE